MHGQWIYAEKQSLRIDMIMIMELMGEGKAVRKGLLRQASCEDPQDLTASSVHADL